MGDRVFRSNQRNQYASVITNGVLGEVGLLLTAVDAHHEQVLLTPDQAEAIGRALVRAGTLARDEKAIDQEDVVIAGAPIADYLEAG